MGQRILVIDNYDSFVYTIVGYLEQLGAEVTVKRNDTLAGEPSDLEGYDGVLISPGPGTPAEAGSSMRVIQACASTGTPMLGVCLGHQALAEVYGAVVTHAEQLMHGKVSQVRHDGDGVFAGLKPSFTATRYHSLAVVTSTVPDELDVTAWTGGQDSEDVNDAAPRIIMGLAHRSLPLFGVQFHPESVLTEGGHRLFANWLALTGDAEAVARSEGMAPLTAL